MKRRSGGDRGLRLEASGSGMIGHAGAVLLHRVADRLGLVGRLRGALTSSPWMLDGANALSGLHILDFGRLRPTRATKIDAGTARSSDVANAKRDHPHKDRVIGNPFRCAAAAECSVAQEEQLADEPENPQEYRQPSHPSGMRFGKRRSQHYHAYIRGDDSEATLGMQPVVDVARSQAHHYLADPGER